MNEADPALLNRVDQGLRHGEIEPFEHWRAAAQRGECPDTIGIDAMGVVRNGYLPEREVLTGIGPVKVRVPRVRERTSGGQARFESKLVPDYGAPGCLGRCGAAVAVPARDFAGRDWPGHRYPIRSDAVADLLVETIFAKRCSR